jgi:hypothetical protein
MIQFSAASCSTNRYVQTVFFVLPSAFLTARDRSSPLGQLTLAGIAGELVSDRSDGGPSIPSIRPWNSGGDAQKLSLTQLRGLGAVDAVPSVTGIRGVLGVAGANTPAGRKRTDVIEQQLEMDILAADALDGIERTLLSGAGVVRSDIDVLNRLSSSSPPSSPALAFQHSSLKKWCRESLNGLNFWMFLSVRGLAMSLGTAYLFTPIADPRRWIVRFHFGLVHVFILYSVAASEL